VREAANWDLLAEFFPAEVRDECVKDHRERESVQRVIGFLNWRVHRMIMRTLR
jgi:hypothetical protein